MSLFDTDQETEKRDFSLSFGGGLNLTESPFDINPDECTDGANFTLTLDDAALQPRDGLLSLDIRDFLEDVGFVGTTLDGYAQYVEHRETQPYNYNNVIIHTLLQADAKLYDFVIDTSANTATISQTTATGTGIAALETGSRLRGYPDRHSAEVERGVIITDLSLNTPVLLWRPIANTLDVLFDAGGDATKEFYARYCLVSDYRAWFGNIRTGSATAVYIPHMVVASEVDDVTNISTANKPSDALGEAAPFFILMPDYSPAFTILEILGSLIFMTGGKNMYALVGFSSKDFALEKFFGGYSGVRSTQPADFAGNDIAFINNQGVQTLAGVRAFGDVETDDLSRKIRPVFSSTNARHQRVTSPHDPTTRGPYSSNDVSESLPLATEQNVALSFNEETKVLWIASDGSLWGFYKSFHDQLAKDVSLLRQGPDFSGWLRITSGLATATTGGLSGVPVQSMYCPEIFPFYLPISGDSSDLNNIGYYKTQMFWIDNPDGLGLIAFVNRKKLLVDDGVSNVSKGDVRMTTTDTDLETRDYTATVENEIVTYRVSKMTPTPSGKPFKSFRGEVIYRPKSSEDIDIVISFIYSTRRTLVKQTTLTLPGFTNSSGKVASPHYPKSMKFDVPDVNSNHAQIGVSVTTKEDFEILKINFYVKA